MSSAHPILEQLESGPVLTDGGMASALLASGELAPGEVALAPLRDPDRVAAIHRGFLEAGSQWLQTCSFGANRMALQASGISESVVELNRAAVRIARDEALRFPGTWVAGNIGPASLWNSAKVQPTSSELKEIYAEQGRALMGSGVDLFVLETFGDEEEALLALASMRELSDRPVIVSLTFVQRDSKFVTLRGENLLSVLLRLAASGANAVGINCGSGSAETLDCVRSLVGHVPVPLCAKPNLGLPKMVGDAPVYEPTPEEFAAHMTEAVALGVAAVGGCCGTTSEHIVALRRNLLSF